MTRRSELPEPVLNTLPDGAILIDVGGVTGIVHSDHLIAQKVKQVEAAWLRQHGLTQN